MSFFSGNRSSCIDISTNRRKSGRKEQGASTMELFIPLIIFVAWVVLQAWVLPRFGVHT